MELVNDGGGGLHRPVADLFGGVVTQLQHLGDVQDPSQLQSLGRGLHQHGPDDWRRCREQGRRLVVAEPGVEIAPSIR